MFLEGKGNIEEHREETTLTNQIKNKKLYLLFNETYSSYQNKFKNSTEQFIFVFFVPLKQCFV